MAKGLIASQYDIHVRISKFISNSVDKVGQANRNLLHFQNRVQLLELYWSTFSVRRKQLLSYKVEEKVQCNFSSDIFDDVAKCPLDRVQEL